MKPSIFSSSSSSDSTSNSNSNSNSNRYNHEVRFGDDAQQQHHHSAAHDRIASRKGTGFISADAQVVSSSSSGSGADQAVRFGSEPQHHHSNAHERILTRKGTGFISPGAEMLVPGADSSGSGADQAVRFGSEPQHHHSNAHERILTRKGTGFIRPGAEMLVPGADSSGSGGGSGGDSGGHVHFGSASCTVGGAAQQHLSAEDSDARSRIAARKGTGFMPQDVQVLHQGSGGRSDPDAEYAEPDRGPGPWDWIQLQHPERGFTYFLNQRSNETAWAPPEGWNPEGMVPLVFCVFFSWGACQLATP